MATPSDKFYGRQGAVHDSKHIALGNDLLTPLFGSIAVSSSGNNEVVAAVAGYRIRVLAYNFMSAGAVNAKWRTASTDLTGLSYMDAAGKGKVAPFSPVGWFQTAAGEALNLNLSTNVAVGGELVYVLVAA